MKRWLRRLIWPGSLILLVLSLLAIDVIMVVAATSLEDPAAEVTE